MATAMEDSPEVQQIRREQAYEMPRPKRGQQVIYYPNGIVKEDNAEVAWVGRVSRKNVEVTVAGGLAHESVRHVSDPRTNRGVDARLPGLWDFSEWDRERDARMTELEKRVDELESILNPKSNNSGGSKTAAKSGK